MNALALLLVIAADPSMRPTGSSGVSPADACLLAGGAACLMTGDARYSGAQTGTCYEDADQCVNSDGAGGYEFFDETGTLVLSVTTAGVVTATSSYVANGSSVAADYGCANDQDCRLNAAGTGSVQLMSGDSIVDLLDSAGTTRGQLILSATVATLQNTTSGPRLQATTSGAFLSNTANVGVTTLVGGVVDNGGNLITFYGGGLIRYESEQVVTCAAGVATLNPTSSHISIDAAGAACAVTMQETSAATIGPGVAATIYVATSAGAGTVTFPAVANVIDPPALCETTGLPINGTMTIMYANESNDTWVVTGCQTTT